MTPKCIRKCFFYCDFLLSKSKKNPVVCSSDSNITVLLVVVFVLCLKQDSGQQSEIKSTSSLVELICFKTWAFRSASANGHSDCVWTLYSYALLCLFITAPCLHTRNSRTSGPIFINIMAVELSKLGQSTVTISLNSNNGRRYKSEIIT